MTGTTISLLLATGLFSLTTLAALAKLCMLRKRAQRDQRELESYKAAYAELSSVIYSIRNIFDHFDTYVDTDEKLGRFLWQLGMSFPQYVEELPGMLQPLPPGAPSEVREGALPSLPFAFRDGRELDKMVNDINDPVFNRLWEIRSPAAIGEMLRHGLFLSFGYTDAVAMWKPDGVNLNIKPADVGYTNWGLRPLEALRQFDQVWRKWRTLQVPQTD